MALRIQLRRDTAANWTAADPILADGEVGVETDASPIAFKIGDGVTAWSALSYFAGAAPPSWDGDITDIDFAGGAEIAGALADGDLFAMRDISGTPANKTSMISRIWDYILAKFAVTPLPVNSGGTGGATIAAAQTNLGSVTRTKAVATARTNNTESLDPELTGDTLLANTTYEVDFYFPITADAAGGIRFGFSVPSLLQSAGTFGAIIRESGAVSTATATSSTYINIRTVLAACTTGLSGHFRFRTGGSGGNFGVFWAQQTTNAAATTLLAGASYTITQR